MNKNLICIVGVVIIVAGLIAYIISLSCLSCKEYGFKEGYREACKDFYEGHLKMDLIEQEDGTKELERIEENNNVIFERGNGGYGVVKKQ